MTSSMQSSVAGRLPMVRLGAGAGRPALRFGCACFLLGLDLGQRDGQVLEGQLPFILGQLF